MNRDNRLTFIDLFAGIGGMRRAFERSACRCVFSSEWDSYAQKTYDANFGETPHGDITKIPSHEIPEHNMLVAGFPCQPFSISGVSKKNSLGRPHGFQDRTQGTLFFEVARILKDKTPDAFVLENVKNLLSHDRGRTFTTIYDVLSSELGYDVHVKVLDASSLVPQHRERIFIVGFREPRRFSFPVLKKKPVRIADILDDEVDQRYFLTEHLWNYLQAYAAKHRAAGNGFGYGLVRPEGIARTLSARYFKDGSEILIPRGEGETPRRLTPRECARLMGFPEKFRIVVSDTQAYKQFGNSVVVPVVEAVAREVVKAIRGKILSNRLFRANFQHGRVHQKETQRRDVPNTWPRHQTGDPGTPTAVQ